MDIMSTTRTNRPILVAIPGTLCAPMVFDRMAQHLADDVTVAPIDWLRSAGPWDVASVSRAIADQIDNGPALVIGHSTGGAIALHLAATYPSLVTGLVVVNSGAHMRGHGDADAILDRITNAWGPDLFAALMARSFATPPAEADLTALLTYAATVSQQATLDVLRSQRDLDLTPLLPAITCPVTVVHGTLDHARTTDHARELTKLIPNSTLRFVATGHSPVYEDPATVADEVRALINGTRNGPEH